MQSPLPMTKLAIYCRQLSRKHLFTVSTLLGLMWLVHQAMPSGQKGKASEMVSPAKVAVYAQVGNPDATIWDDLFSCISNVATAQSAVDGEVDVFVSTVDDNPNIDRKFYTSNLSEHVGIGRVEVRAAKNLGADIGQWFQQLLDTSLPSVGRYSAVLKIHSKSHPLWRRHMTEHLCGSPCVAEKTIETLRIAPGLGPRRPSGEVGIIGPKDLVFVGANDTFTNEFCQFIQCWPGDVGSRLLFHQVELEAMMWTWQQMKKMGPSLSDLIWPDRIGA